MERYLLDSNIFITGENRIPRDIEPLPRRVRLRHYYERYQRIIDGYNREQDRATIGATFEALMKLSEELLSAFSLPIELKQDLAANGGTTFSTLHVVRDDELSIVGMGVTDFRTQESNGTR